MGLPPASRPNRQVIAEPVRSRAEQRAPSEGGNWPWPHAASGRRTGWPFGRLLGCWRERLEVEWEAQAGQTDWCQAHLGRSGHFSTAAGAPLRLWQASLLCPSALCLLQGPSFLFRPPLYRIILPSIGLSGIGRAGGLSSGSIKTSWLTHSHGQWCLGKDFRGSSRDHTSTQLTLTLPLPLTPRS